MQLLSAFTPAHTHPETFAYRIDVTDEQLYSSLLRNHRPPNTVGDVTFAADDSAAIRRLHGDIEAGARLQLLRAERTEGAQRLHLQRMPDAPQTAS